MVQTRIDHFVETDSSKHIAAYGASITEKDDNVIRLAFQNINGMQLERDTGSLEIDSMSRFGIDVIGMAETNIHWSLEAKLKLSTLLHLKYKGSRYVTSSMRTEKEGYQPGGTLMMALGVHCGRVYKRGSDKYGRFTWMALHGKNNTGIIVVTAYRSCRSAGENTSYVRQWHALRNEGVKDPDPRQSILDAISTVLRSVWKSLK